MDKAEIKPFVYEDKVTGHRVAVEVSPHFSTIHIDDRIYYFTREDGDFDGTSTPMGEPPVFLAATENSLYGRSESVELAEVFPDSPNTRVLSEVVHSKPFLGAVDNTPSGLLPASPVHLDDGRTCDSQASRSQHRRERSWD
jgi:hypothetical protein